MISRRTLAAAAWTAPVIAACSPVPAFATSPIFSCAASRNWCKTANGSKWDFKFWPVCQDGVVASVLINGKPATYVPATGNRSAHWVLRAQPHSYTFSVQVRDGNGTLGFNKTVDTRTSSCGV